MSKFPANYKIVLKRDITTGEQTLAAEELSKNKSNGKLRKLENMKYDDLRSYSRDEHTAQVTLEVSTFETQQELIETIKDLRTIWGQQKAIRFGQKELKTIE